MAVRACAVHPAMIIETVVIVDLARGQIPCSTERITSFSLFTICKRLYGMSVERLSLAHFAKILLAGIAQVAEKAKHYR